MQTKSGMRQTGRVGLMMLATLTLLSGCNGAAGSATSDAICRELRLDLPTYSRRDTPDTLASGARFLDVFDAGCGG